MRLNALTLVVATLFAQLVFAVSGEGHATGIPKAVLFQAINFILYVGVLVYFVRKPIRQHFLARSESFKVAMNRAQSARNEAEQQKREIRERLTRLETGAESSLAKAKSEAEALRASILNDARGLAENLKEDARRTADFEIERAKLELRDEMLAQSLIAAKKLLGERIQEPDQKRLQNEFVEKIQVVR